jgi:hypothetical protein
MVFGNKLFTDCSIGLESRDPTDSTGSSVVVATSIPPHDRTTSDGSSVRRITGLLSGGARAGIGGCHLLRLRARCADELIRSGDRAEDIRRMCIGPIGADGHVAAHGNIDNSLCDLSEMTRARYYRRHLYGDSWRWAVGCAHRSGAARPPRQVQRRS